MSSDFVLARPRVLRGAAATALRSAAIDADLTLLRPATVAGASVITAEEMAEAAREAREEAARVGYEDGYQAGLRQLATQADERARTAAAALGSALDALDAAGAALRDRQTAAIADVEEHIVDVALEIARAVIGRELAAAEAPARDALVRALALAPPRIDAVARVHPADIATIGDLTPLGIERCVTIVPDAAVERGGCIVDVGACRIDAQIGPSLDRVREALEQ